MTKRKSYHQWCGLWVDANAWEKHVIAADRKRARKAAKRRRDAELTRLGRVVAAEQTIGDTCWRMAVRLDDWLHGDHDARAAAARLAMRTIHRGEVQP